MVRVGRIVAAYLLASAASALAVTLVCFFFTVLGPGPNSVEEAFRLWAIVTLLIAALALVPALVAIGVAEWRPIRHAGYYAAVATVVGIGEAWAVGGGRSGNALLPTGLVFGPVAGWIYWRLAGQRAGMWRGGIK